MDIMKKCKFLFCLICAFYFNHNLFAQTDSTALVLHDSIYEIMYYQDSLDEIAEYQDSFAMISMSLIEKEDFINWCRAGENFTPNSNVTLFNNDQPYTLVYFDDFEQHEPIFWQQIDECNDQCWGTGAIDCEDNNEDDELRQYYNKENIEYVGGKMIISANDEDLTNVLNRTTNTSLDYEFTSGFLKSNVRMPSESGQFAARIRLPLNINGNALNPAFWLMSGNYNQNTATETNELDIFELFDSDHTMTTTIHKDVDGNWGIKKCPKEYYHPGNFFNEWHTYHCIWNKVLIAVFIDGKLEWVHSHYMSKARTPIQRHVLTAHKKVKERMVYPTKPMSVFFCLQTYLCDEKRNGSETWPQTMEVDWFRMWYKADCDDNKLIDNRNQIPHEYNTYNMIVGEDVTLDIGSPVYTYPERTSLRIIHNGTFTATSSSNIVAGPNSWVHIGPGACFPGGSTPPPIQQISQDIMPVGLKIYPNPTNKTLKLDYSADYINGQVVIVDMVGRRFLIDRLSESLNLKLDLSGFSNGMYAVIVTNRNGEFQKSSKFVVCQE